MREGRGAKPTVLRCSRCGMFVDWEEARLQVVDGCRPHLDMPPVLVRAAEGPDREAVLELFARGVGQATVVAFGEVMNLNEAPALVAEMKGELAGALAYRLLPEAVHIIALATDPMWQRSGVGGHLVSEAERLARAKGLDRLVVATTNDNLPSLYFYQRQGYRLTDMIPGGLLFHPKTPAVVGFGGIPVCDELRLEKRLDAAPA